MLGHVPSRRERDVPRSDHARDGPDAAAAVGPPRARHLRAEPGDLPTCREPSFAQTRAELIELLEIGDLVRQAGPQLSLGERMKVRDRRRRCCTAARAVPRRADDRARRHDAEARSASSSREYNERHGATVLLTSHYMADVDALCPRVIVIHHGRILFDGDLTALVRHRSRPQDDQRGACRTTQPTSPRTARSSTAMATGDAARSQGRDGTVTAAAARGAGRCST